MSWYQGVFSFGAVSIQCHEKMEPCGGVLNEEEKDRLKEKKSSQGVFSA